MYWQLLLAPVGYTVVCYDTAEDYILLLNSTKIILRDIVQQFTVSVISVVQKLLLLRHQQTTKVLCSMK